MKAAATIIRKDIRMTAYNMTEYPHITSFTKNVESMVPETLQAVSYTHLDVYKRQIQETCPFHS